MRKASIPMCLSRKHSHKGGVWLAPAMPSRMRREFRRVARRLTTHRDLSPHTLERTSRWRVLSILWHGSPAFVAMTLATIRPDGAC